MARQSPGVSGLSSCPQCSTIRLRDAFTAPAPRRPSAEGHWRCQHSRVSMLPVCRRRCTIRIAADMQPPPPPAAARPPVLALRRVGPKELRRAVLHQVGLANFERAQNRGTPCRTSDQGRETASPLNSGPSACSSRSTHRDVYSFTGALSSLPIASAASVLHEGIIVFSVVSPSAQSETDLCARARKFPPHSQAADQAAWKRTCSAGAR